MPTATYDEVWDVEITNLEPAPQPKPRVTVQDEWSKRLCRYGLVGLTVRHADHGQCHIVESNFLTREATTPDLYLWFTTGHFCKFV